MIQITVVFSRTSTGLFSVLYMPPFGLVQSRPWFPSSMWISSVAGISKILCTAVVRQLSQITNASMKKMDLLIELITFYYINTSVLLGFLPLRKSIYFHMKNYDNFTCKNLSQSEIRKSSFVAIATSVHFRVFNRSRVCEGSFLSFSVSRLFSVYKLWNYQKTWQKDFLRLTSEKWKNLLTTKSAVTREKRRNLTWLYWVLSWQKEKENRQVEEIPPQELDNYLSRFLLSVRKKNRDEYEPSTLRGFIVSIERYLKKCRYSESVITGQNFARTRDALKSKQKHLKRLGEGNKPNEASSLTPEERDILFERKEMGFSSQHALVE